MGSRISIPVIIGGLPRFLSLIVDGDQPAVAVLLISSRPVDAYLKARHPAFLVPPAVVGLLEEELDILPTDPEKAADLNESPYRELKGLQGFLDEI